MVGLGSAAYAQFPEREQRAAPAPAPLPAAVSPVDKPAPRAMPTIDESVFQVQVLLDRAGFAPGVIDGKTGASLTDAIRGYQEASGIEPTGRLDQETRALLMRDTRPALRELALDAGDLRGQFVGVLPREAEDQAKLEHIGYRNAVEKLAEKFHTTPETILALNDPNKPLRAGSMLRLPDVRPTSRAYGTGLKPEHAQLLSDLNVGAGQPKGDRVVVDKSERVLKVYDGEQLIAQFPATMGSAKDPLPLGEWTINSVAYLPPFHYQPDLFWDVADSEDDKRLPPGPNGPVGVAWLDLSKEHYGIHGTGQPQTIGRAESHGCIRLSNWDVARLSRMVDPGTKAVFQA